MTAQWLAVTLVIAGTAAATRWGRGNRAVLVCSVVGLGVGVFAIVGPPGNAAAELLARIIARAVLAAGGVA